MKLATAMTSSFEEQAATEQAMFVSRVEHNLAQIDITFARTLSKIYGTREGMADDAWRALAAQNATKGRGATQAAAQLELLDWQSKRSAVDALLGQVIEKATARDADGQAQFDPKAQKATAGIPPAEIELLLLRYHARYTPDVTADIAVNYLRGRTPMLRHVILRPLTLKQEELQPWDK